MDEKPTSSRFCEGLPTALIVKVGFPRGGAEEVDAGVVVHAFRFSGAWRRSAGKLCRLRGSAQVLKILQMVGGGVACRGRFICDQRERAAARQRQRQVYSLVRAQPNVRTAAVRTPAVTNVLNTANLPSCANIVGKWCSLRQLHRSREPRWPVACGSCKSKTQCDPAN